MESGEETSSELISCEEIINRVRKLLSYRLEKQQVNFSLRVTEDVPKIRVKAGSIQQVFLNLLGNALDAVKGCETRTIDVHIAREEPEGFVRVRVADTGRGIPADAREKIFDPFFTTKPVGKGTGLGLSVSHGIVEKHGGILEVASREGEGSVFTVCLPVS